MRSFEAATLSPTEFVAAIRAELVSRQLDRHVTIALDGDRLTVELRWLGTTRFDYRITPLGDGFRAELAGQRVAPLHGAFRDPFEATFEDALAKAGAKSV